jgi:CDGSH-type Zn-finger protein
MVNGPLWVSGGIPVDVGDEGALETRMRVALCRCGASGRKPLCDGSHKEAGFVDDPRVRD